MAMHDLTKKTSIAVPIVPETQDTPSDSTPVELLFPEEHQVTLPTKPIDALSSLHSTPIRPQKEKTTPKEKEIPSQFAKLSRRSGMTFLSQLTEKKEKPMESGYSRTWKLPRKPSPLKSESSPKKQSSENTIPKTTQRKRTTTQTAGRKRVKTQEKTKLIKNAESDHSDIESETHAVVDQVKSLLSTPKYKLAHSIDTSPVSINSESEDDSPNILAFQQALTCSILIVSQNSLVITTKEGKRKAHPANPQTV